MIGNSIMAGLWLNFLTSVFYLAAAGLLLRQVSRAEAVAGVTRVGILTLAGGGLLLHAAILVGALGLGSSQGINFGISTAISLVAWVVVDLYLVGSLARPIENLGIVLLPTAALATVFEWVWPGTPVLRDVKGLAAGHIILSIVAYGLLCLAAVQGLLVAAQERGLRRHHPGGFIRALPPVLTMESVMFQMIAIGFGLLTAAVASGLFFSEQVFGRPFRLSHHTLLPAIAWVVYGVLLLGRWRLGWRGMTAVRWTLGGFALLVLGYFGTKFILEIVLSR